jgi:hypothetical protein
MSPRRFTGVAGAFMGLEGNSSASEGATLADDELGKCIGDELLTAAMMVVGGQE